MCNGDILPCCKCNECSDLCGCGGGMVVTEEPRNVFLLLIFVHSE